jgi:hypothetical protein
MMIERLNALKCIFWLTTTKTIASCTFYQNALRASRANYWIWKMIRNHLMRNFSTTVNGEILTSCLMAVRLKTSIRFFKRFPTAMHSGKMYTRHLFRYGHDQFFQSLGQAQNASFGCAVATGLSLNYQLKRSFSYLHYIVNTFLPMNEVERWFAQVRIQRNLWGHYRKDVLF